MPSFEGLELWLYGLALLFILFGLISLIQAAVFLFLFRFSVGVVPFFRPPN
jgi:hypothetical protein